MMRRAALVLLLLFPSVAFGGIAEVGGGTNRVSTQAANFDSTTIIFPGNVTADNLMVCVGNIWQSTAWTTLTITDTRTSSWSYLAGTASSSYKPFIAYAKVPSTGANTVTIDPNGVGNYWSGSCTEFSGTSTGTLLDADGGNSTGASTTPSDGITTVNANALIVGIFMQTSGGNHALTAGSGFTTFGEIESPSNAPHHAEFKVGTTAGAYTVDGTIASAVSWEMQSASFLEATGGGGGGLPPNLKQLMGVGQ